MPSSTSITSILTIKQTQVSPNNSELNAPLFDRYWQAFSNTPDLYKTISEKTTGLSDAEIDQAKQAVAQLRSHYPLPSSLAGLIVTGNEDIIDELITLHKLDVVNLHAVDKQPIYPAIHSGNPSYEPPMLETLNAIDVYCQGAMPKLDPSDPFISPDNSPNNHHHAIIGKLTQTGISVHGHTDNSYGPLGFALGHPDQEDLINALLSNGANPFDKSYAGERNVFSKVTHFTQTSSINKLLEKMDSSELGHKKILCEGAFASDSAILFETLACFNADATFSKYLTTHLATKSFDHIGAHGAAYLLHNNHYLMAAVTLCVGKDDYQTLQTIKKAIIEQSVIFENTLAVDDQRNCKLNALLSYAIGYGAINCVRSLLQTETNKQGNVFQLFLEFPHAHLGNAYERPNERKIASTLIQHIKSTGAIPPNNLPDRLGYEEIPRLIDGIGGENYREYENHRFATDVNILRTLIKRAIYNSKANSIYFSERFGVSKSSSANSFSSHFIFTHNRINKIDRNNFDHYILVRKIFDPSLNDSPNEKPYREYIIAELNSPF